jgi:hypothetical protein
MIVIIAGMVASILSIAVIKPFIAGDSQQSSQPQKTIAKPEPK